MGDIPSVNNMPSCKFQFPTNGGNVDANTQFTVVLVCNLLACSPDHFRSFALVRIRKECKPVTLPMLTRRTLVHLNS